MYKQFNILAVLTICLLTSCTKDQENNIKYQHDMTHDVSEDLVGNLDMWVDQGGDSDDSALDMDVVNDQGFQDMIDMEESSPGREFLSHEVMMARHDDRQTVRVPMEAFEPAQNAQPVDTDLELVGTISFTSKRHDMDILRDDYKRGLIPELEVLPDFEVTVQRGADAHILHAVEPWFTATTSALQRWWIIPGAGRLWSEPMEDGEDVIRVAMPITLVEARANCSFHGMMTALYNTKNKTFSDSYYQISQETCLYFKASMWGWLQTDFEPTESLTVMEQGWHGESVAARQTRLEVKPLSEMDALGVRTETFLNGLNAEHITAHGVLLDGVHYRGRCMTRDGEFPWCEELVVPSYSIAKSLIAGLAYITLKHNVPALDAVTMGAHLNDISSGWSDVSVGNLLDMRSGHYESAEYMVDEAGETMSRFFLASTDSERLASALSFERGEGEAPWVYHTSDTLLAVRTMQAITQARFGQELMPWLVQQVFEPLTLSMTSRMAYLFTYHEDSGEQQHLGGYGSFWHVDDVLRLVQDLVVQAKNTESVRYDRDALLGVLQRREGQGARAHSESVHVVGNVYYYKGFWAMEVHEEEGFPCDAVIPFMSGFGGLTVAILPHNAVYYIMGDHDEFVWLGAVKALAGLPGFCGEAVSP